VGAGVLEEAADDRLHALGLAGDQLEGLAIGVAGRLALLEQHGVAEHGGERVVDLVGDLGGHDADRGEPVAAREGGLEGGALGDPARHLVDSLAEQADLARAADRGRVVDRAGGDRVGVAGEGGERAVRRVAKNQPRARAIASAAPPMTRVSRVVSRATA